MKEVIIQIRISTRVAVLLALTKFIYMRAFGIFIFTAHQ